MLTAEQQRIVESGMGMVRGQAKLRAKLTRAVSLEELVSVGYGVLVEMVAYYRPELGEFDKFTSPRVFGAMVDFCRKTLKGLRRISQVAGLALSSPADADLDAMLSPSWDGRRAVVDSLDAEIFSGIISYLELAGPTPEEAVISKNRYVRVCEIIERYLAEQPPRGQAIFRAYFYEQQTIGSIAAREGISRATVERTLQQHRDALRALCIKYAL